VYQTKLQTIAAFVEACWCFWVWLNFYIVEFSTTHYNK